jgi:hypothetical protein
LDEALRFKPEGSGLDSRYGSLTFFIDLTLQPLYGPGVESASNKNEFQESFLGVKTAGA